MAIIYLVSLTAQTLLAELMWFAIWRLSKGPNESKNVKIGSIFALVVCLAFALSLLGPIFLSKLTFEKIVQYRLTTAVLLWGMPSALLVPLLSDNRRYKHIASFVYIAFWLCFGAVGLFLINIKFTAWLLVALCTIVVATSAVILLLLLARSKYYLSSTIQESPDSSE